MGKPLMIREEDNERLEELKKTMGAKTKVQVLREALDALEAILERGRRIRRWMKAASLVKEDSARTNLEFQSCSRFKRHA